MRKRDVLLLGAIGGAVGLMGARVWRRHRRRIDLNGRVVIVTGGSSGHGLIVAREAARQGAHLVLAARSADELEAAKADLDRSEAASVMAIPTDIREEGQVRTLIDQVVSRHNRVDVLINNAAIIQVGPLDALTLDDFREAMETIYWGSLYATMAVLPQMRRQGFGRIGNVVSLGGKIAVPHLLPYVAAKYALTGLTQGLRAELARSNILVTGLYPPIMRTGGHTHALFKGKHQLEHGLFAIGATLPGLSVSAHRVARQFLDAICHGDAEVIVSWPAYLAVILQNLLPNEAAEILALTNQILPDSDGHPTEAIRGEDIPGVAARLLNQAMPREARPEIQAPPRGGRLTSAS